MITYLLVVTISTVGAFYFGGAPPERVIVGSPEAAAVRMWECRQTGTIWTRCHGALYRVDLASKRVEEVPIPALEFKEAKP